MSKIRINGFIEAFERMVVALEESRNKSAPLYRKAVEDWAVKTAEKARENLNRPSWLLSNLRVLLSLQAPHVTQLIPRYLM